MHASKFFFFSFPMMEGVAHRARGSLLVIGGEPLKSVENRIAATSGRVLPLTGKGSPYLTE